MLRLNLQFIEYILHHYEHIHFKNVTKYSYFIIQENMFITKMWFYFMTFSRFRVTVRTPFLFFLFFSKLVCVLGEPMSRPCPRTPEPFRTPGPDRKTNTSRQRDLSTIQRQITHTNTLIKASHTRTYESAPVDTWRWEIYLEECNSCTRKKDALRQVCTHRN